MKCTVFIFSVCLLVLSSLAYSDKSNLGNRLILESSPYLLQHANNPVDWYPWGKEAFDRARQENKPIFLSIGYAACHWCHVMRKESFENIDIARFLNKHFIAIKVDRERRPDIDEFYGNAVMAFQGHQGWPMSVFLTPDKKPFYGGTYYPAKAFRALLSEMSDYWTNQREQAVNQASQLVDQLYSRKKTGGQALMFDKVLRNRAIKSLLSIVDRDNGGFGEGSKFPREPWLYLLLDDSYGKAEDNLSLMSLRTTLTRMAYGGIYDQLGGGFHRYTTDPHWRTPHFEKMLYNQALLVPLYLRANDIYPDPLYRMVAQQTLDFVLKEMRSPQGGFYASLDADSEGGEGHYYLWTRDEWQALLNNDDSRLSASIFDVDEYGEMDNGDNVLYFYLTPEEYSDENNILLSSVLGKLNKIRFQLKQARNKRIKPALDKKIIMAWNGLAITALVEGAMRFSESDYLTYARGAARFIWENMQGDDHFYRINFQGKNSQDAQLEDYAYYLQALIALYDIDQDRAWLDKAKILAGMMQQLFWDNQQGGFYDIPVDQDTPLPIRPKTGFDKTLPSGNAVAARMFIRLARRTGDDAYYDKVNAVLALFFPETKETPSAFSSLLVASREEQEGVVTLPVYAARGHVRIDAFIRAVNDKQYTLNIEMKFDDKWHINSHTPFDTQLIPTAIRLQEPSEWTLSDIQYPEHEVVKLGFSQQALALYQGYVSIRSLLKKGSTSVNPSIRLRLQACNDQLCLPPEDLLLYPRFMVNHIVE
ncbi:MAG: DUF255 domain-containing protein [Gammaproteobacteria bacterium]|nr:DUF255 domain-containing protein [Gammaproteobacteria bacterium]